MEELTGDTGAGSSDTDSQHWSKTTTLAIDPIQPVGGTTVAGLLDY